MTPEQIKKEADRLVLPEPYPPILRLKVNILDWQAVKQDLQSRL